MNLARSRTVVVALISLFIIGEFVVDLNTPLGIADWILYCVPLLLSVFVGGRSLPFLLAAVLSALTLAGFYLSPPGIDPGLAFISRMIGIGVFWVMAFLIWQRKRAEEQLLLRKSYLPAISENQPGLLWLKDAEGRFLMVNKAFAKACGRGDPEKVHGLTDLDVWPRELAEKYRRDDRRVMSTGNAIFEEEMIFVGNSNAWYETFKTPVRDDKGNVIGTAGYARDITERKQAGEAMRRQNEYLTALQETMLDVASQLDLDRLLENILKRAGQLMGTSTGFLDLLEPGDDHLTPKIALGVLAEESLKYKNKPGEGLGGKVWQAGRTILIEDYDAWPERIKSHQINLIRSIMAAPLMSKSGFVGVLGLAHEKKLNRTFGPDAVQQLDQFARFATIAIENARLYSTARRELTQRKEAEAALRESEERYRRLFDLAADAVILVDSETHRYVDANQAAQRLYGYSREEFLQMGPENVSAEPEQTRGHIDAGDAYVPLRWHRKKNGERFAVEIVASQIIHRGRRTALVTLRDITARLQAEMAARESQALYHSLVDQMPAGVFRKDRAGRYVFVNSWLCQFHSLKAEQFIGRTPEELEQEEAAHGPKYPEILLLFRDGSKHHEEILRTGKPIHVEEIYVTADGGKRHLHVMKSAVFGPDGQIVGTQGIQFDITERKQMEADLARERDLWQTLLDNSPDHIYFKDTQSRFIKSSEAQARQFGLASPDEMVGKTDFDFFGESHARPAYEDEQEIIRTGRPMIAREEREEWKDGHVTWASSTKMPMRDGTGKIIGIMGISRDITERKRVEQQLVEEFGFNRKIISDAPAGIVVFKASGQCVLANETAARALNATVPQILEQNFRHIASWHASGMLKVAEETLATGEPRECEAHFVSTFGREVWLVCHFSHFVQNDEPHLLIIFSDFTEKKKLEAQLMRAQRMESIGTLAGGIAHDLNNVLTPLLMSVQILKEKIPDTDAQTTLDILETNVVRGASLIKQLLAFGRGIEGERITIQPRHIGRNIGQIVDATFPKSIAFEFRSPADLWPITGDPTQIEQVLLNLCLNARDAMPRGGKLSMRMENKVLGEADTAANLDARPGRHVVISVADTGEGMTRETQDRIFEPFFTTKEQGKGTGLGLSTTLAIVKSHDGFITCYSELGRGSVFKVYLPASPGAEAVEKPVAKSSLPRGHNELVLVVDDEKPILNMAQTMLEKFGYRVLPAANGAEAIKIYALRQDEIAAVITDMAMPVMDGRATIIALRALNPKVKVIGSSGLDMNDDAANAAHAATRRFIPKPYTLESMLNILHEVLQDNSAQ
jgi:PAS domain S-box-containing protein